VKAGNTGRGRTAMNRISVVEFTSLDGVVEDPDGSAGTPSGGWAFRYGPEAVAGDKFLLGSRLDTGALLLGRHTWQLFSKLWPARGDEFATRLNNAPKWVASRTLTDLSARRNSSLITGELTEQARRLRDERDVIVIGSTSLAHTLMQHDLVDEYRLLVFPTVLGTGQRLFGTTGAADLRLISAEQRGPAVLLRYETAGR
jgi:dihydrofolate reductase